MLRDDERDALAEMAMEDDGPDQLDPDLMTAIRELTEAVRGIKAPVIPPFDVTPVAAAVSRLAETSRQVADLRKDVRALTEAVSSIKSVDMSAISEAIKSLQKTKAQMIEAMTCPKEIVFDEQGNPTGIRVVRIN